MFKKKYPTNPIEPMKCITFDKKAQDNLPLEIKAKMKADRDKARAREDDRIKNVHFMSSESTGRYPTSDNCIDLNIEEK